jgi:hypothetical protein
MSHLKERTEKTCLNCHAELHGRYCHVCGQENLEPKESVWHLVNHFFQDITHFDGKFFSTVKYLLTKPGFLSKEYMVGRRASYLNPIRMYVFTSAFFFLVLFSMNNTNSWIKEEPTNQKENPEGIRDWEAKVDKLRTAVKTGKVDSADVAANIETLNKKILAVKKIYGDTSTRKFNNAELAKLIIGYNIDSAMSLNGLGKLNDSLKQSLAKERNNQNDDEIISNLSKHKYLSIQAYDSAQNKLAPDQRDGWLKSIFEKKLIDLNRALREDKKSFFEHFKENFFHSFPKIFFICLPLFALILKLLYIRRKEFYYTSHGIFTIHLYCAIFILMLLLMVLQRIDPLIPWEWLKIPFWIFEMALLLYMFIYLYKAMRVFYGQGRMKTFVKFIMVTFFGFMITVFLMALFIVISAITI